MNSSIGNPGTVTVRSASVNIEAFTYNEDERKHEYNKKGCFYEQKNEIMGGWICWSFNGRYDERECLCT